MQEELKKKYLESLEEKSATIKSLWERYLEGEHDVLEDIRRHAHSLKGSGATFGFPEITEVGRALEEANETDFRDKLIALFNTLGRISSDKRSSAANDKSLSASESAEASSQALIIERNASNAKAISQCINKLEGIESCVIAETGAAARQAYQETRFSLIVLDIVLPDQDGREILRDIKGDKTYNCPVLVISGVPSDQIYLECMSLGADQYLSKPFDTDKLYFEARQVLNQTELQIVSSTEIQAEKEKSKVAQAFQFSGERILVAEDDEMQGIFIARQLTDQGADVTVVENGQLALDALEKESFSAVILDGWMPVMDGFETLKAIRANPRLKGMPVIMVTAMGSEEDIIRGYEYGTNDYILKPFSEEQLFTRIRSLLVLAA